MNERLFKLNAIRYGLGSMQLQDKSMVNYFGDDVKKAIGEPIYICSGPHQYFVLPDGIYQTITNMQFCISAGVLKSINTQGNAPEKTIPADQQKQGFAKINVADTGKPFGHGITPAKSNLTAAQQIEAANERTQNSRAREILTGEKAPVWGESKPQTTALKNETPGSNNPEISDLLIKPIGEPEVKLTNQGEAFNKMTSHEELKKLTIRAAEYINLSNTYGDQFNISKEEFLSADDAKIRLIKDRIEFGLRSGQLKNRNQSLTQINPFATRLTPLEEALKLKGWD